MKPTTATKTERIARTARPIMADANGELPTRIEVLQVGIWRTPYHGDFMITPDDLAEYVTNFVAGTGMVVAGIGLPIDFSHDDHKEAAGWMTKLYVEGESLMADVDWSSSGKEALLGKRYKCFSPSFYPRGRGGWVDPEDAEHVVDNVVVGGGLTNIPLFKGLQPVMASTEGGKDNKNVLYMSVSVKEKEMQLEDVVKVPNDELTDEQREFLTQNKDQLTDEQKQAFGFEVAKKPEGGEGEEPENPENKNKAPEGGDPVEASAAQKNQQILADINSGKLAVVSTEELAGLKASQEKFERKEAADFVDEHIARGAIKADQKDTLVEQIVKADSEGRKSLESLLTNLPDNKAMQKKEGDDKQSVSASAVDDVRKKAKELVEAASAKNETLDIGTAIANVLASDKALEARYIEESKVV